MLIWVLETYRKPNANYRSVSNIKGVIAIQIRAAARQALTTINSVRKALASLEVQITSLDAVATASGTGMTALGVQIGKLGAEVATTKKEVQSLRTQINGLATSSAKFNKAASGVGASAAAMTRAQNVAGKSSAMLSKRIGSSAEMAMKSASQFQWYSRQLMYNWGLPLLLVGGFATKWALETQAAMVQVSKVYGDLTMNPEKKKKELNELATYFEAVSNRYGMLQKDVIAIGAAWASAGAQSVGLALATKLTVETMMLGEMSATEATKALISIQESWRLNTEGLKKTIGELNLVENQTAVTMQGLIEGFVRTGSAARISGISTGDLAAMIAALVPAAGNATVAGNALKTIFSRLAAPTRQAKDAMKLLGINIESSGWKSKTARGQLEQMAGSFSKLDKNQKQLIATQIAGRQQYNKFVQLMDAMADKTSAYYTALDAVRTGTEKVNGVTRNEIQYQQELNQVLNSNPQLMKIATAQLQNMAINAIAPLIPYMIALLGYLKKFADWLAAMPDATKKLIVAFLLFAVGASVIGKVISAFKLLWPVILGLANFVMSKGKMILGALTNPWVIGIAIILAIINLFPSEVAKVVQWVANVWSSLVTYFSDTNNMFGKMISWLINAFYALPQSIQNAMMAVVRVVQSAAMAVYELFSYLNPFAHHSPSLVENVTRGMAVVAAAFSTLPKIAAPISRAYASVKKFKDLMASYRNGKAVDKDFADTLKNVKAVNPAALSTAKDMISQIKSLQKELDKLQTELDAQQAVVDRWKDALDNVTEAVRVQQNKLDDLSGAVDYYQNIIDSAKSSISDFASAPLKGMQAMKDEIESNTEAQNVLKLAMAQMEQAGAGSFNSLADRMAALSGEFETLTSKRDELVKAGAGSEILSYYDKQINSIQDQKKSIDSSSDAYAKMADQLAKLQKQGDILDLKQAVNFDPLTYQIDKLANAQKELSFDDVVKGIKTAQDTIDKYTPALNAANAAYAEQKAIVDALKKKQEEIQRVYDSESFKLDTIKKKYDAISAAIDALKKALNDMGGAADAAGKKLGKVKKPGGGGGGGGAGLGKGTGPIKKPKIDNSGIEQTMKDALAEIQSALDKLDLTKPIREAWDKAVQWWKDNIQPGLDAAWGIIWSWLVKFGIGLKQWWAPIGDWLGKLFGNDFQTGWDQFVGGIQDFITNVSPGFQAFWVSLQPALKDFGTFLQWVFVYLGMVIAILGKTFMWLWNSIIKPLLGALGTFVGGIFAALGAIGDFANGFRDLFSDPQKGLEEMWKAMGQVLHHIMEAIGGLIKGFLGIVLNLLIGIATGTWGMVSRFFPDLARNISAWFAGLMNIPWVKTFVDWVVSAFTWLYDVLLGHSIIPDIINGITGWFTNLVSMVGAPLRTVVNGISGAFTWVWDQIKNTPLGQAAQAAVAGIGAAFQTVPTTVDNTFGSGSTWSGIDSMMTAPTGDALTGINSDLGSIFDSFSGTASDIYGTSDDWNKIGNMIKGSTKGLTKGSKETLRKIYQDFMGLPKDIKTQFPKEWNRFSELLQKPVTTGKKLTKKELDELKKLMDKMKDYPKDDFKGGWDKLNGYISTPVKTGADNVSTEVGNIKGDISSLGSTSIPTGWQSIDSKILAPIGKANTDVATDTQAMKNSITGLGTVVVPAGWNNVESGIATPVDKAKTAVDTDISTIKSTISGLHSTVPDKWDNVTGDIVGPIRAAQAALKGIHFSVGNITGPLEKIRSKAHKTADELQRVIDKLKALGKMGGSGYNKNGGIPGVPLEMANGGAVHGPGTSTSDSINTWLSVNEHVLDARDVSKLGGQADVYALRSFINRYDITAKELINSYRAMSGHSEGGNVSRPVVRMSSISTSARSSSPDTVSSNGNGKTVTIEHAHFEFPNIKNPSDAKEFLDNLESLL